MILWISIGVFIVSLISAIVLYNIFNCYASKEWVQDIPAVIASLSGVMVVIMLFCMIFNYWGVNGYKAKLERQQTELQYQVEHTTIISRYKTMKDIEDWNNHLASKKVNQRDFWIGVFIPDIYDDLDFVEMK